MISPVPNSIDFSNQKKVESPNILRHSTFSFFFR